MVEANSVKAAKEPRMHAPRRVGSFDAIAGTLNAMFNFDHDSGHARKLFLDPVTGQPVQE
jgi:hypothetical protein